MARRPKLTEEEEKEIAREIAKELDSIKVADRLQKIADTLKELTKDVSYLALICKIKEPIKKKQVKKK